MLADFSEGVVGGQKISRPPAYATLKPTAASPIGTPTKSSQQNGRVLVLLL